MDFAIATPPSTPSPTKPRRQLIDTLSPFKYVSPTKSSRSSTPYKQSQKNFCPPNSGLDDDELPRVICQPEAGSSTQTEQCLGLSDGDVMPGTSSCSPKRRRARIDEDTLPLTPRTPKKRKKARPYAPPETYEHLYYLQDLLELYQKVVFCGINPGCQSGKTGLHYAHSTNHFWQCLHLSGLTERQLAPEEAHLLPEVYEFGLTNLVDRPTAEQSELSKDEMNEGVPLLMDKLIKYRPRTLCFLGKGIWDVFQREAFKSKPKPNTRRPSPRKKSSTKGVDSTTSSPLQSPPSVNNPVSSKYFNTKSDYTPPSSPASPLPEQRVEPPEASVKPHSAKPSFKWGLQPFKLVYPKTVNGRLFPVHETLIFVLPSPSARVVAYQWWDKAELFKELKEHLDAMEEDDTSCDTSRFAVIPLITTKSVYFM